jgi:hypothetical protein
MNNIKIFYPIGLIIVGLIGIFFLQSLIIFDGGLYSDINLPETMYENDEGAALYTFSEVHEHITHYAQSRAGMWVLDLLSVYLFGHGVISLLIKSRGLKQWFTTRKHLLELALRIVASCILSLAFWFVMIQVIMILELPLH